jgi:hypothetical protein
MALALPQTAETSLTAVLLLATAVWIGGLVAIFVMARVARAILGPAERVAFFRGLPGRGGIAFMPADSGRGLSAPSCWGRGGPHRLWRGSRAIAAAVVGQQQAGRAAA